MRWNAFRAAVLAVALFLPARAAVADIVGTVHGLVTRDGRAVARATIVLEGSGTKRSATSDATGRFAFARVPFGTYALRSEGASRAIAVASDGVVDVALELAEGTVIGRARTNANASRATVSENAIDLAQIATLPGSATLDRVVATLPGIVRFSFDEPVAHGFHGMTYELDGAPLPRAASANFSDLFDVRDAAAVEVYTGAFPAEFGGTRMGAIVNVRSANDAVRGGTVDIAAGSAATREARASEHLAFGDTRVLLATHFSATDRGIDAPTATPRHDRASLADQFIRIAHTFDPRTTLAFDVANQYAGYEIPYATTDTFLTPVTQVAGTDDVQREYDRFAALSFARTSADGTAAFALVPWVRSSRIAYDGDLARDVRGQIDNGDGTFGAQNGVRQDRRATYLGVRSSYTHSSTIHTLKVGLETQRATFSGATTIAFASGDPFVDRVAQAGTQLGAFVQDRWTPNRVVSVQVGLRADRSTGFTFGSQLSPRLGLDLHLDPATTLHAYFGRLYAAPTLEDTRRDAIVTGTSANAQPVYDLQPQRDSYQELGIAYRFAAHTTAYANAWIRNATNVLDTTQLANTPLFGTYNNAVGRARGLEFRVDAQRPRDAATLSLTLSRSLAGGISGGTFLFAPAQAASVTLDPEDHDQSIAGNVRYTHSFDARAYATLVADYGTGYPVQFQNGAGRLPNHTRFDLVLGRRADSATHALGYALSVENLTGYRYPIKVDNGFNTTQIAQGLQASFRLTAPF